MPRVTWLLEHDYPVIKVELTEPVSGVRVTRTLLADTGAGRLADPVDLILPESDCRQYLGRPSGDVMGLGGAIVGAHPVYFMWREIPALSFARAVRVVAVPAAACPAGLWLRVFSVSQLVHLRQLRQRESVRTGDLM